MKKSILIFAFALLTSSFLMAGPIVPMNKAFNSLMELIPFLAQEEEFSSKKNEKVVGKHMQDLASSFGTAKHDSLMKQDIFAPSLDIIRQEIKDSHEAFKAGKKDYAWWRMRSITAQCMSCHTRLPANHASSFQEGFRLIDKKKFKDPYNLGIAYLIVRQYPEAKENFTRAFDENVIKKQFKDILLPLKQLLLIQTKVMKDPAQMLTVLKHYENTKGISVDDQGVMKTWMNRLKAWSEAPLNKYARLSTDEEAVDFMAKVMRPLFKNNNLYVGKHDVDLLMASGLLSNFLFENPESKKAPDALYWVGVAEKYLERENFFGTGEHFLKDCVRRYPKAPIARECFNEYKESIEFNFSGSRGTDIPADVQRELDSLEALISP